MTARRQASTTSLAQYARAHSPDPTGATMDFCNSFWGVADGGVDVLFARIRGTTRTMEELRNFWKERASIEEDYSRRMAKLAKSSLGRDELNDLRNSFDIIRGETDKQASYHAQLAQQLRNDLENQCAAFITKQAHHKKTQQAAIEKEFRAKQTQESYVNKAREKYEQDCLRINSYTAQSTLVQGKDLEKIQLKLERTQQTVSANERDFANFARTYTDTCKQWEVSWKTFCDSFQDLEEERLEFIKDNMWAYANAVSTVCVNDDESCEALRLSLESFEPERDLEFFVHHYGTGNAIPDPPPFVNYTAPDAQPSSTYRGTSHAASFSRSSQRSRGMMSNLPGPAPEEEPAVNTAGVGAGRSNLSRSQSRAAPANGTPAPNGTSSSAPNLSRRPTAASYRVPPPDTTVEDLKPNGASGIGDESDPLKIQLDQLRNSGVSGSTRRNSVWNGQNREGQRRNDSISSQSALSPPSGGATSPAPNRDYRNSAEVVVGAYPGPTPHSRPTSPSAAMMQPGPTPASPVPVEDVLRNYGQSFPGERRSISRPNSRQGSFVAHSPHPSLGGQMSERQGRPVSRDGHAGIGAHGRSTSPAPYRSASPNPPPGSGSGYVGAAPPPAGRTMSPNPSLNQVGIALDPSGRVAVDTMADHYAQQQRQGPPPQQAQQQQWNQPPPPPNGQPPQRRMSYQQAQPGVQPAYVPPPPTQAPGYGGPQRQASYSYQQQQQPPYQQPPAAPYQQPPPPPMTQPMYQQPPQPQMTGYAGQGYYQAPAGGAQPPMQGHQQQASLQSNHYRAASPQPQRTASPQAPVPGSNPPTGQYSDDGKPVLFYVRALYDYQATIEEEFDFQAGDIIAVTATPEDGWWSGELLDEQRRQGGRHVFPSNFVVLF